MTTDLFSFKYPAVPGSKGLDTSAEAAAAVAPDAGRLRGAVMLVLRTGNYTADEIADRLGESILAIRPRCSELRRLGLAEDSGERRLNRSGKRAAVWRARV